MPRRRSSRRSIASNDSTHLYGMVVVVVVVADYSEVVRID